MNLTANNIGRALRYLIGSMLLFLSLRVLFNASTIEVFSKFNQPEAIRYILGISEVIASILFLLNQTKTQGVIGLFLVFLLAAYIHLKIGQMPWALLLWIAGIIVALYLEKKKSTVSSIPS